MQELQIDEPLPLQSHVHCPWHIPEQVLLHAVLHEFGQEFEQDLVHVYEHDCRQLSVHELQDCFAVFLQVFVHPVPQEPVQSLLHEEQPVFFAVPEQEVAQLEHPEPVLVPLHVFEHPEHPEPVDVPLQELEQLEHPDPVLVPLHVLEHPE